MPLRKSKKKSVKSSLTKRVEMMEGHLLKLDAMCKLMSKFGNLPEDAPEQMQESLESTRRLCGAVHKEASDFIDYLKQVRLEIDEFKETTMKEIKTLASRTKQYSLDDNKEILLEDD